MNSYVLSMLFAAVQANTFDGSIGSTCITEGAVGTWTPNDLSSGDVTDAASCETACMDAIGAAGQDHCCNSIKDGDDNVTCILYSNEETADEDIRGDYETQSETDYSVAFAWFNSVNNPQPDLDEYIPPVEEEEEEEDAEDEEEMSVRMTASALAAASITMLAM